MVLSKEQVEQRIQGLLSILTEDLKVVSDFAVQHGIERIPFMGGYIHFGRRFDGDWVRKPDMQIDWDRGKVGETYIPAVKGPIVNGEFWSASTYDCWPDDSFRTWLFGDDPDVWRRTDYELDGDEPIRYPKGIPVGSYTIDDADDG